MKAGLFLLYPVDSGAGTEKYFAQLARGLSAVGVDITVFGCSTQYLWLRSVLNAVYKGVNGKGLGRLKPHRTSRDLGSARVSSVGIRRLTPGSRLRADYVQELESCDVIYCKNEWPDLITLRLLIGRAGMRRVIVGVHTSITVDQETQKSAWGRVRKILYGGNVYRRQLANCALIHTCNSFDREFIANRYGQALAAKTVTVPLWLENPVSKARSKKLRKPWPLYILFAQRLTHQKGVDCFEELVTQLSRTDTFPRLRFTLVGSGDYEHLASELARRFPRNVEFRPFTNRIEDIYAYHDLVVVPSRWETFSFVTLEAQSAGLPVLATDIPGPNGVIENGVTGWLVPLGDTSAMAKVILELAVKYESEPGAIAEMGANARQSMSARFGRDVVFPKTLDMLRSVGDREAHAVAGDTRP